MPLPTSGPISLSMIRAEFGGTAPDSLSEYYAGGANVPAGTSGTNGPVPASGPISFSHFYGTQKLPPVVITDRFASSVTSGTVATAVYSLRATGSLEITNGTNVRTPVSGEWLTSGSASAYQVRATLVGDPSGAPTGTFDTWSSLGSVDREWTISSASTVQGLRMADISIEIRRASDLVVVDTALINLSAERIG